MERVSFKIRQRIIKAFLFSVTSVLIFGVMSFQVHREIGHRLKLLELTGDILFNIMEIRRHEKNFFLYRQHDSLREAMSYVAKVMELYESHESEIEKLKTDKKTQNFPTILNGYQNILEKLMDQSSQDERTTLEESLRNLGQNLITIAEYWEHKEREKIDELFKQAMYLFVGSVGIFMAFGIVISFYVARSLVDPLFLMKKAMDKIASGDFTPIPETGPYPEEFDALFKAFNRMAKELEIRQDQLAQSKKMAAVGTLTAGIAHELNNPINNIVLTAETLRDDFYNLEPKEALKLIHDIVSQADRASEIVKELLDFSRSEYPRFEPVSIIEVIEYTMKLVKNQLSLGGIQVEKEFMPDMPRVYGDKKSLQQVFLNLIVNAIQAMPGGGTLTLRSSLSEDGKWIKIDVTDTGVGIDARDLPHIFDPFYTTKEVGRGTGLGLSVSYGIVRRHNGYIEVASEKGKGSTFTVVLPPYTEER